MSLFILLFALIALSVSVLRSMRKRWTGAGLPRASVWVSAPVACLLVGSCALWIVELGRLMIKAAQGDLDALTRGVFAVILAGLGLKLAVVVKVGPLKDFIVESLLLRSNRRQMGGYTAEQAQQVLDDHHRQMHDTEEAKRLLGPRQPKPRDARRLRAEIQAPQPVIRPPDLANELKSLAQGSTVELTDSWRLFWYARDLEEPAEQIVTITLDARPGVLTIHQVRDDLAEGKARQTLASPALKQDLFDLMAGAWNSSWINPYVPFIRSIAVIAYGATVDTFGVAGATPVVKTQLAIAVFQNSEHGVRDIRDLVLEALREETS